MTEFVQTAFGTELQHQAPDLEHRGLPSKSEEVDVPPMTTTLATTTAQSNSSQPRKTPPESIDIDKSQPEDFEGQVATNNEIPSVGTIKSIEDYIVLDKHGKTLKFKSLYSGSNCSRRVLVIFIRHFFCGMCQDFVRSLCEAVTPDTLLKLPISTFITIVGCGDPALIDMYARETNCPFPIYTDPKRSLFMALGMTKTLAAGKKPEYAQRSFLRNALDSTIIGIKHIPKGLGLKSGDKRQVGGEFLFEPMDIFTPPTTPFEDRRTTGTTHKAENGQGTAQGAKHVEEHLHGNVEEKRVTWCHRMKTTRDHSELEELKEVLGLKQTLEKEFQRKGTGLSMARQMSQISAGADITLP